MHVHTVADDLAEDLARLDNGADGARIAMAQRTHRIEAVGGLRDPELDGLAGLIVVRIRMADADGHPCLAQLANHLEGAGQLRSERHQAQVASGQ